MLLYWTDRAVITTILRIHTTDELAVPTGLEAAATFVSSLYFLHQLLRHFETTDSDDPIKQIHWPLDDNNNKWKKRNSLKRVLKDV